MCLLESGMFWTSRSLLLVYYLLSKLRALSGAFDSSIGRGQSPTIRYHNLSALGITEPEPTTLPVDFVKFS
ncbi:hypothetical protein QL093DRAFT_1264358 [Fusarium oxysporum]|nr:hypothetical protein QL093DRAFT_1264358 [Fusarium oxysporum]